jgi:hypothetical protein
VWPFRKKTKPSLLVDKKGHQVVLVKDKGSKSLQFQFVSGQGNVEGLVKEIGKIFCLANVQWDKQPNGSVFLRISLVPDNGIVRLTRDHAETG